MKTINLFIALVLVTGLALVVGPLPVAQAATITVTSTSGGTGGPDCTLRDAITAANTDTATGGCPAGSGADVIVLATGATYTLTAVDNTTDDANGLPSITSEITINGSGAIIERSSAAGIPAFRIFHVGVGGTLTLDDLTVSNGYISGSGGAICNEGTVNVTNSTLSGNSAGEGGGIFNQQGTVTLADSTVSGNSASLGGGIFNNFGEVTLTNSTVSGNSASSGGGGIQADGPTTLTNSTVSGNSASFGGGIWIDSGPLTLSNTIVGDQLSGGDCYYIGPWKVTSLGHNLDSDGSCGLSAPGDLTADPKLGPLQLNAPGNTATHALLPGSPAIDAGDDSACPDTDQRGVARPQGGHCDIGAYEAPAVVQCTMDIRPFSDPNSINLQSKGVVPVAVLTTDDFEASSVDPDTVEFAGAPPKRWTMEDVDGDGDVDLLFHFKTQELKLDEDSTAATLTGETRDRVQIESTDTVNIVPKDKGE